MFVAVRNFGPFEHVEVELKPLTIIVGKNNVGKSTLAYLIWALAATTRLTLGGLESLRRLRLATWKTWCRWRSRGQMPTRGL